MKHNSEISLDRDLVKDLANTAAELEQRVDRVLEDFPCRNAAYAELSLEVREGIFQLLALVAGLDEDLPRRLREVIAEYLEQIYAFHAKLEEDLESLEGRTRNPFGDGPVI